MTDSPASGPRSPDPFPALRVIALIAAILGVLVLAAAAFVLSYPGIHQLARTAGMPVTLARVFPVIFDALLVVSLAATASLHGAGWWRRGYSWLITLLLLAAIAAGGVLHTVHPHLPHQPAAITAAVLPWVLLLIAFSLLLCMLRQFRQPRSRPAAEPPARAPAPAEPRTSLDEILGARIVPVLSSRTASDPAPAAATPASPAPVPATPAPADSSGTDAGPAGNGTPTGTGWAGGGIRATSNGTAGHASPATSQGDTASPVSSAPESKPESDGAVTKSPADTTPAHTSPAHTSPAGTLVSAPSPHFDRLRSTPTPPEDDTDPDA